MAEVFYHNHLKGEYAVENGDNSLLITSSSCYRMNEETLSLIDHLPELGSREYYVQTMSSMGINKAAVIFDRLVTIGALVVKQKKNIFKNILFNIIKPDIKLFSSESQRKVFKAIGVTPQDGWFENNLKAILFISSIGIFLSFIFSFTGIYNLLVKISVGQTQTVYLLVVILLSSFVHEIGHSFAAASAGIGLRPIGFSVYLFYPVFYTNVSGMEKLSLREKVSIDCGGFITQSFYLLIILALWFFTKNMLFLESIRWISLLMAFNFNPLLRTDGYWLYQDIRKGLKYNKIVVYLHYLYIAAFFAFTLYLFYYLFGKIEKVYDLMLVTYKNPAILFHEGYKIILGLYMIIMYFVGGSRRLKEAGQEWLDLRKQTSDCKV
jgi:hypothetical protein